MHDQPSSTTPDRTAAGRAAPGETDPAPGRVPGTRLLVVPWTDVVLDAVGFDPRTAYVEQFWLPLIGPTSTWLLRRFAATFDEQPDGFESSVAEMARSIGIGSRGGRNSALGRSIQRCIRFGLVRDDDHDVLAVRRRLPALTPNQVRGLTAPVRAAHRRWQQDQQRRTVSATADLQTHAVQLVETLAAVGAPTGEIEDQLRRWGFDDTTARRSLRSLGASPPPSRERVG